MKKINNGGTNKNTSVVKGKAPEKDKKQKEMDTNSEEDDDEWFSDSSSSSGEGQEKEPRLVMYAAYTQYEVVKEVAKATFNFHLTKNELADWDVAWFDGAISLKLLQKMWPNQRTNHFPGMYNLARKNCLGRHLMRMKKWLPQDYDFFPVTFMIPTDYKEFKYQFSDKRNKTFIVKPEASCQGKGIFLTRNINDISPEDHCVVQRYTHKPFLIEGFKFDLRLYILLAGINPLRIYLYDEGLARFATQPYESPQQSNLDNLMMHLTNYAINKDSENFVANVDENRDDIGSKRSFTFVKKFIKENFGEEKLHMVLTQINDIIIKTMCIAQPYLYHLYRSAQPDDLENSLCFQILGFDVILDQHLKPQLLEVNQSPSFTTDSPLDYKIKKALITDTIKILNLSISRKLRTKGNKKAEMQKRLLGMQQSPVGQTIQPKDQDFKDKVKKGTKSPFDNQEKQRQIKKQAQEHKEQQKKKKMLQREKFERDHCGAYDLIYPLVSYTEEFKIIEEEQKILNAQVTEHKEDNSFIKDDGSVRKTEEGQEPPLMSQETVISTLVPEYLREAWEKQQHYLMCMDKAKSLWESFTQGNAIQKRKREQEEKEKEEAKKKKEEQMKKKARWQQKMKKIQEEKRLREEAKKEQEAMNELEEEKMVERAGSMTDIVQSSRNNLTLSQDILEHRSMMHNAKIQLIEFPGANNFPQLLSQNDKMVQRTTNMISAVDQPMAYQNVKRHMQEEYDKHQKFAQLMKYLQTSGDGKIDPSLIPQFNIVNQINVYMNNKEQQQSNVHFQQQPLITSETAQLYERKKRFKEMHSSDHASYFQDQLNQVLNSSNQTRIDSKIQSKKQSIGFSINPNQKLSELLNLHPPSQPIQNNVNNTNSNNRFLQGIVNNQLKSGNLHLNNISGPSDSMPAISHYTIPSAIEMIKHVPISSPPNDLPQMKFKAHSGLPGQALPTSNLAPSKCYSEKRNVPKRGTSDTLGDIIGLGVVGKKKQIVNQGDQLGSSGARTSDRVQANGQGQKKIRVLQIKETNKSQIVAKNVESKAYQQIRYGSSNQQKYINPRELFQ